MEESVSVNIQSPRGAHIFSFPKTTKVAEVIEAARQFFGFESGAFTLKRQASDEVMAPERPLVSYHLTENETLLLIPEMGSGA